MAGKEGAAERMLRLGDGLAEVLERQLAVLAEAPAERAAESEKVGRAVRSLAAAGKGVADLDVAASRALADDGDEDEFGEAHGEDEELGEEELAALRADVERRYARFDQEPAGPQGGDHGDVRHAPAGGADGLGRRGAHAAAAPP